MAFPFTDDFTDVNGTGLAAHNAGWSVDAGAPTIQGNTLHGGAAESIARWTGDVTNDDQVGQYTWLSDFSDGSIGGGFGTRKSSNGATPSGYVVYMDGSGVPSLYEVTAGSYTLLSTGSAIASGSIIELESVGTMHTTKVNGSTTNAPSAQVDSTYSSGSLWLLLHGSGTSFEIDSITFDKVASGSGVTGTGVLQSGIATMSGIGKRKITGVGAVQAGPASMAGVGKRIITGNGSLQSGIASMSGTGSTGSTVTGTGVLQSGIATMSGIGKRKITGVGAVQAGPASMAGVGKRIITGNGSLQSGVASMSGSDSAPHRAEQIMQAISNLIGGLSPLTVDKVIRGRATPYALNINKAISLSMGSDELIDDDSWPDLYSKLIVNIDIHARSNSVQVTQEINEISKVITTTIWADYTLGLLFVSDMNELAADEAELNGDGNIPSCEMRTKWAFKYRRNQIDPSK